MEKVAEVQVLFWHEEVRQLTEAGSEIHPMHWIKVDKKRTSAKEWKLCFCSWKGLDSIGWLLKLRGNTRTSHRHPSWWCGFAQYRLQLVCAGSRPNSRMRFYEWIPSRSSVFQEGCLFTLWGGVRRESEEFVAYGRSSRIVQCRWTRIASTSCHRWNERTSPHLSMQAERFRPSCRTRIVASIEEHVSSISWDQFLLFTLRNKESKITAVMSSNKADLLSGYFPEGAEAITLCSNNSWLAKKNTLLSGFAGKSFDKTRTLVFVSQRKTTLSEYSLSLTTRNKAWHERLPRMKYINWILSHSQSLAWMARQTRPDLSHSISTTQSTFENACVRDLREFNRVVEYAISTSTRAIFFSRFFYGVMQSLWRSVMPVSVKNRNKSTGSLRT